MTPRILVFDIETSPIKAFVWRMFKEFIGINQIDSDWYILCWAAKWLDEKEVYSDALVNHKMTYKKNPENDKKVVESLWKLLDEADIVITHNGNRFDIPKMNARFLDHGMDPPSPCRSIDTCQVAKSVFGFTSNKLDYIAQFLGVGAKIKHTGFQLWADCIAKDKKAWKLMIKYNIGDVTLLEDVYMKLRPWIKNHPNVAVYVDNEAPMCNVCSSTDIIKKGISTTNLSTFQRYKCKACGKPLRGRITLLSKDKRKTLLANII